MNKGRLEKKRAVLLRKLGNLADEWTDLLTREGELTGLMLFEIRQLLTSPVLGQKERIFHLGEMVEDEVGPIHNGWILPAKYTV